MNQFESDQELERELAEILPLLEDRPAEHIPSEPSPKNQEAQKDNQDLRKSIMLYLHDMVTLLCVMMLVLLLCFRAVVVKGDSMYNTLVDGDYLLLLNNIFYQEPQAGDIIVAAKESFRGGEPIIKRVIATEGQKVDIDFSTGTVYVDDTPLEEDYIYTPTTHSEGVSFPLIVEEGCVFVMGDNRGVSKDSRDPEIGLIDQRQILGKAIFLLLPGTDGGTTQRQFYRIGAL